MMEHRWGTWEELLLGGAVLRHGTRDWDIVAGELRSRTIFPYSYTPEICKSKYELLRQRYSGCTAWYEELRKQRIAELKQALEQSEDSIGSLESKLKTLKAEKVTNFQNAYGSSQPELPLAFQKSEGFNSKEASKDGLSAGSYTQETQTNWSPECQNPASVSADGKETKSAGLVSAEQNKCLSFEKLAASLCEGQGNTVRKRRGKRKRKMCSKDVKEGSVGESDCWGSADIIPTFLCRENSTCNSVQIAKSSAVDDCNIGLYKDEHADLLRICNSVIENENGCIFHSRLDSQKRGRYKKLVRRHMDLDTIRSRIASGMILSPNELFRDLLLLTNNVLVFYSKNTHEYKSALQLRDFVSKALQLHYKDSGRKTTTAEFCFRLSTQSRAVKPRSVRRGNCRFSKGNSRTPLPVSIKPSNSDPSLVEPVLPVAKKSFGRPRKIERAPAGQRPRTVSKGRKRVRTR